MFWGDKYNIGRAMEFIWRQGNEIFEETWKDETFLDILSSVGGLWKVIWGLLAILLGNF